MFVVLSAGMLTALTATATLLGQTAFADKKKCEDNSDNNCNDQNQNMKQNECKIENENKDHSDNNLNSVGSQTLICTTIGINPGHAFTQTLSQSDQIFGAVPP